MRSFISKIKDKILNNECISFDQAMKLINIDERDADSLGALFEGANEIREKFMGRRVDLCGIINAKSGKCPEDCKYCAQSIHYDSKIQDHGLLKYEDILKTALKVQAQGVTRFSLVTSGRGIAGEDELEYLTKIYTRLKKDTKLKLCASHGIISYEEASRLRQSGVTTYHHNVETSKSNYPNICTTHTYQDRIKTIKNVQKAGLNVCCGGIIGMGETPCDRVNMAFEIKELGISSVPINILTPIKGTPLEDRKILSPIEILKTMAIYRYIIPHAYIRYAGGRKALKSRQIQGFQAGVNAALVGDYLTTLGNKIEEDKEVIRQAGLEL